MKGFSFLTKTRTAISKFGIVFLQHFFAIKIMLLKCIENKTKFIGFYNTVMFFYQIWTIQTKVVIKIIVDYLKIISKCSI